MSCPGAQNFCSLFASQNFDLGHSFLLASSATGSARKRPHFDTSPFMSAQSELNKLFNSHQTRLPYYTNQAEKNQGYFFLASSIMPSIFSSTYS